MSIEHFQLDGMVPKPPEPKPEEEIIAKWQTPIDEPLVSIQCMTYNHAAYVKDALNGFLMQETNFPIEIWVHDDASTDGTREILEEYKKKYPKIIKTILQSENQYSQGYTPKYFLRGCCKGKYYALCEGDDFWTSPRKLTEQLEALKKNNNQYICIHPAYMHDLLKNQWERKFFKGSSEVVLDVTDVFKTPGQFSPTSSYFILAQQYNKMPDWYFESRDLPFGDFFIESIMGLGGILYIPSFYSVYRVNVPGSYTSRTQSLRWDQLLQRLKSLIFYTNKLSCYSSIPTSAILDRKLMLYKNYLRMSLSIKSFEMYRSVLFEAQRDKCEMSYCSRLGGICRVSFFFAASIFHAKKFLLKFLSQFKAFLS